MASSKESDDTLKSEKKSNVFVPFDSGDEIELPKKEIYLLGECTHGTQEFYDIRAEISMELVRERGVKVRLCVKCQTLHMRLTHSLC